MPNSSILSQTRIQNGVYEAVYQAGKNVTSAPDLELVYLGNAVAKIGVRQIDEAQNTWLIRCNIPAEFISDGVHTFLICNAETETVLGNFSIVAGEPLEDDLKSEISLLREELDMLKRAFRRHCVETIG